MSVKERIFIPMLTLTFVSCVTIAIMAMVIYNEGLNQLFVMVAIFVSIVSLIACFLLARYISGKIEKQVKKFSQTRDNLLQSMDTMIMVTEIESDKIMYMNERFITELKLSKNDIGKTCWETLVPNATERCSYCPKMYLKKNSDKPVSWEHYNPQVKKWFRIDSRYIDWADGHRVFIEQIFNITEAKEMLEEVENARDEAVVANKAKTAFLANMSHEVRTPLNSIIGFSELALDDEKLNKKTQMHLESIQSSAEWLLGIIDDILDISKLESGNKSLVKSPFDMGESKIRVIEEVEEIDEIDDENNDRPQFKGEVLIFEDNKLNQQVLREHLYKVGISSMVAENGVVGVDIIKQRIDDGSPMFDLVFMDMHMPEMDGMEATAKILELDVKVPIIALTANIMTASLHHYKMGGVTETLGKPFKAQDLWKCLSRYLIVEGYVSADKGSMTEEDIKMLEQMRRFFVRNNQTTYDDIVKAIKAEDYKKAHILVHSLKSNAGYIKEARLQRTAAVAEAYLISNPPKPIDKFLITIKEELDKIYEKYGKLLEDEPDDDIESVNETEAKEILDELEELLKNRDTRCLKYIKTLKGIPDTKVLIAQIEAYNFRGALLALERIKEEN
ncbi:MAG: response regulator [Oscillospiraceae bacterium]|jgi:CheY-like chemotaxis protein|nr:response regulator [Oscillospiraceae bacterium]